MRHAILADIHANLTAFQAVLDDIKSKGEVEEVWCLGDIVGYGPDPRECLELLRRHNHICITGNHDWAAVGKVDISDFNPQAAAAVRWTSQRLSQSDSEYLTRLPQIIVHGDFTLAHGSPRHPIWEYLLSTINAKENFTCFQTQFCLVGHSHVPLVYELDKTDNCLLHRLEDKDKFKLAGNRLIINPGSVGQPRDGDPRASYAIYDSDARTISHYRISYDVSAVQAKMKECRLPAPLITRLGYGE